MDKYESLEIDSMKICESLKGLYGLDNVIIIATEGDKLITLSDSDDSITKAILRVADKFHNEGKAPKDLGK